MLLTKCTIDDESSINRETPTDFNQDISDKSIFTLSTPIELKITNLNLSDDNTAEYKVSDTLKFNLKFNANYQDTATDTYDILESTGASEYLYKISQEQNSIGLSQLIDLDLLSKNPELKKLSPIEIKTSPIYKDLFINSNRIPLKYNSTTKSYEINFGVILKNTLPKSRLTNHLITSTITENIPTNKDIVIRIPVINDFSGINIRITE